MNRYETDGQKIERQLKAVAGLRLEQGADEESHRAAIAEAARRAIKDHWPEMPEDEQKGVVEAVVGMEALNFQLSIFRYGWSIGANAERIPVDPEETGPRILVRAYGTAEADTIRMRIAAIGPPPEDGPRLSLEERLRRYLPPLQ